MATFTEKDYYQILGVSSDASQDEIRHAFQKKARRLHPDVNKDANAEAEFKEVSEAYAVLSDKQKRAQYDMLRSGSPFGSARAHGAAGQGFNPFADPFGFGFSTMASNRVAAYHPSPGSAARTTVELSSDQAREGCKRGATYEHYVSCAICGGVGTEDTSSIKTCPVCSGTGHMDLDLSQILGIGLGNVQMPCPQCEGSGKVIVEPCSVCLGSGRTLSGAETIVTIPPKTSDADVVRIAGMGNAGTNGGRPGDLKVQVSVPSDRLSQKAQWSARLIGFGLGILAVALLGFNTVAASIICLICAAIGAVSLVQQGVLKRSRGWWRALGGIVVLGFINGLLVAAFLMLFMSCVSPYQQGMTLSQHLGSSNATSL